MSNLVSCLNGTQISQVVRADSLDDATKMNLLEKIIDWFRGDVQYQALAELFGKIADIKKGEPGQAEESNFQIETDRMHAFAGLRQLALPEYRDQFKYDCCIGKKEGEFGCTVRIGDTVIYEHNNIVGDPHSHERFKLGLGKCGMALEDACRSGDSTSVLDVLQIISHEVRELAAVRVTDAISVVGKDDYMGDDGEADGGATSQTWSEAFTLLMQPLSTGSQAMLLSKLTGDLGEMVMSALRDDGRHLLSSLTTSLATTMERLAEESAAKQDGTKLMFATGNIQG